MKNNLLSRNMKKIHEYVEIDTGMCYNEIYRSGGAFMKSLNKAINRFCYRHPHFGIPRLMLYITFISAAVYLLGLMDTTNTLYSLLVFSPALIIRGQIWRLVTWIFITDGSNLLFEALILYFYYFIGNALESQWGTGRFTFYYLIGVALHIIYGFVMWAILGSGFTALCGLFSSYYLNFSMFFAFATLFPEHRVLLFFFIPLKIKWLALVDAAFFIYNIIVMPFPINLLPVVAVLNFLIFCGEYLRGAFVPVRARAQSNVVNFRREVKKAQSRQESQPYRHKCAVCGRTDVSDPQLEFRFCSRCDGYHCFCMDHINNHVHFKD